VQNIYQVLLLDLNSGKQQAILF